VQADGDLERVVRGQVQTAATTLGKVFEQFIGENSHLLKVLDPSGDNQLVLTMQRTLDEVVQQQNRTILTQFSLDDPGSAVNRFLRELTGKTGTCTRPWPRAWAKSPPNSAWTGRTPP
jgi:hypothetical protein